MNLSKQTLLDLLKNNQTHISSDLLTPAQMAHLYINSALLVTIMEFLKEQLWLQNKEDKSVGEKTSFESFITPFFNNELAPIVFMKEHLIESGSTKINQIKRDTKIIEEKVLSLVNDSSPEYQKAFLTQSLVEMSVHFHNEEDNQQGRAQSLGHSGLCLYRTFDNLDDIFELDYQLDRDMDVDHDTKERLYQRSGVGVQSGYSTILLALDNSDLTPDSSIVDLGSGYGRVGLVCSLLRPDVEFIGYEYVPHRVDIANKASEALGLENSLNFKVQDLSLESFKIPDADVYYLYDPFTEETYRHVLKQIVEVSTRKKVTIVTKGNARGWLLDISNKESWPSPVLIDEGNLCIFKSA